LRGERLTQRVPGDLPWRLSRHQVVPGGAIQVVGDRGASCQFGKGRLGRVSDRGHPQNGSMILIAKSFGHSFACHIFLLGWSPWEGLVIRARVHPDMTKPPR